MSWPAFSSLLGLFFLLLDGVQGENTLYKECRPFYLPLDVIFLLDGSGSVSGNTFDMQMNMLKQVAERLDLDGGKSRLAVMQYAGYSRLELQFQANQTKREVLTTLEKIRYMSGSTKTGKALKKARNILEEEKKKPAGGRGRVKQVAIIVSDGHSHDDPSKPAGLLRADGVTLLVLGIGHYINRDELLQIAGSDDRVFQNLHKPEEMTKFVKEFENTTQQIVCDYARKPRGATAICKEDGFSVTVSTTEKLMGALYVSGHYNVSNCFAQSKRPIKEDESIHYDATLLVNYKDCGVQETFTESSRLYSAVVILQFDSLLSTSNDIIYRIRCVKEEITGSIKLVEESVPISRPICRYIVRPIGNCGGRIQLNDPLFHTWQCDSDKVDISVSSCEMMDPVLHHRYSLLDEQGCAVSPFLSEVKQTTSSILTAKGTAIRFSSSPLVYFRCTLRICGGGSCEKQTCRKKREIGLRHEDDYEYNEEFPSADVRKLSTVHPAEVFTTGRAVIKPLTRSPEENAGVDLLLSSKNIAIIHEKHSAGQEEKREEKSPSLIVFGQKEEAEKIIPRITTERTTTALPTIGFPTLLPETTTETVTSLPSWELEVIVESDPLLIRLPHEDFTTNCNKN